MSKELPVGTQSIKVDGPWHPDTTWASVSCSYHAGDAIIGTEERIDTETGEPRVAHYWDDGKREYVTRKVLFPVYSRSELDQVGHDPGCPGCQAATFATLQHAEVVRLDKEQRLFELRQDLELHGIPSELIDQLLERWTYAG
jgi:hypothetical protein